MSANFDFPSATLAGVLPPFAENDRMVIGFDAPAGHVEVEISREDAIKLAERIAVFVGKETAG